eukprot:comp14295_c0_seq1/m.20521 comp14295_c0_seq1/g.20521  ORF comp14295_c0_seq1/g.20521 comp14295_c0_seq1/m.20521 type:complete len:309 (-) comp14295_c0_seq1:25-951(-)
MISSPYFGSGSPGGGQQPHMRTRPASSSTPNTSTSTAAAAAAKSELIEYQVALSSLLSGLEALTDNNTVTVPVAGDMDTSGLNTSIRGTLGPVPIALVDASIVEGVFQNMRKVLMHVLEHPWRDIVKKSLRLLHAAIFSDDKLSIGNRFGMPYYRISRGLQEEAQVLRDKCKSLESELAEIAQKEREVTMMFSELSMTHHRLMDDFEKEQARVQMLARELEARDLSLSKASQSEMEYIAQQQERLQLSAEGLRQRAIYDARKIINDSLGPLKDKLDMMQKELCRVNDELVIERERVKSLTDELHHRKS